jgi:hypothetical protein
MGVKTYIRTTDTDFVVAISSPCAKARVAEVIARDRRCRELAITTHGITFTRRYTAVGNFDADDASFKRRVQKVVGDVKLNWASARRDRIAKDQPRDFETIRRAVALSAQDPTEIEGSAAVPARPYIDRLTELGYNVVPAGFHGKLNR